MTCIRLVGSDRKTMIDLADAMLRAWRAYSDEKLQIFAETYAPHNTITPILRRLDSGDYKLDLVLRNKFDYAGASSGPVPSARGPAPYQKGKTSASSR